MSEPLRILSLGAGVQSSAVLLMSCDGVLPKLDCAIFADTGWEGRRTISFSDNGWRPQGPSRWSGSTRWSWNAESVLGGRLRIPIVCRSAQHSQRRSSETASRVFWRSA